jgi:hypothetical protein
LLVCLAAFAITRAVPHTFKWPVGAGVIASTFTLAVASPALRGFGRRTTGNPTVLPLDYTTSTLTVGVIWTLALAWGLASLVARRRRARTSTAPAD